ncbi:hypothetical protein CAOG_007945 [Capsaspora owczarzaki ATCC 30864]|uniref:Exostosin GT47 domain-containing protein n=1 Tax=Capsaspora owczarzaki (strain ATCC 30864) TaxID=595528 RepID=A0A0D2USB8_CAPO3|nr:hypothetical protein CAOG_007945 [Capsaspora owczarzaki ATCC 30864]
MQNKAWKRAVHIALGVLALVVVLRLLRPSAVGSAADLPQTSGGEAGADDALPAGCFPTTTHQGALSAAAAAAAAAGGDNSESAALIAEQIAAVPFKCMRATLQDHLFDAPIGVLRIFVYEELLPSGDLLRDHCAAVGASADAHFAKRAEEKYFLDWLATSKHATKDPSEAHFFIIPTPIECLFAIEDDASLPALEVVQTFIRTLDYSKHNGADHVLFTSSMADRAQTEVFHEQSKNEYYSPIAEHFPAAILLSTETMYTQWFDPTRDIVIPHAIDLDSHLDAIITTESEENIHAARPLLLTYIGPAIGCPERARVHESKKWLTDYYRPLVKITDEVTDLAEAAAIYRNSSYCFAIGAETPSTRQLYEVMGGGCIPLLLTRNFLLPFSNHIDWELLTMRYMSSSIKSVALPSHLETQLASLLPKRRRLVRRARAVLFYGLERPSPPVASFAHDDPNHRRRAYYTGPSEQVAESAAAIHAPVMRQVVANRYWVKPCKKEYDYRRFLRERLFAKALQERANFLLSQHPQPFAGQTRGPGSGQGQGGSGR